MREPPTRYPRRIPVVRAWGPLILLMALLQACTTGPARNAVPDGQAQTAGIPGIERARAWGDDPPVWLDTSLFVLSDAEVRAWFPGIYGRPHQYLAISGGGSDGAFGAGLLNGWSAAGTRPEFTIVTGISTGALIAPFAFLGPAYDAELRGFYTRYATKDLLRKRSWIEILGTESIADTAPLRAKITEFITPEVLERVAAEGRRGRRLFIGTVNLDQARPVVWDITEIAASGQPAAPELIRDIMLASASVPGAFPPVHIAVEGADGRRYEEMHVDGGTATQVFLYPLGLDWKRVLRKLEVPGTPKVYVVRNAKIMPDPEAVPRRLPAIAERSISSLIRTQGIGDMYRMFLGAKRDGLDYNLAYVPEDFSVKSDEPFDPVYMSALFDLGYRLAKEGYPWAKVPPGTVVAE
ncbi:patatin-like phospholipase family protein [Thiocapsa sp.]|uniref:patatin-like phospholipase family protein n=1 Tax=Thiocapsa sp. TaxID=2024551 RepID=UPI00359424D1